MLRFRIIHLLAIVSIAGGLVWLLTQAGMETAEIEVVEVMAIPYDGPDGSHDNFGGVVGKIRFRFLVPKQKHEMINVFLVDSDALRETDLPDHRVRFRYRSKKILWMKRDDLVDTAIRNLNIDEKIVEEVLIEMIIDD